MSEFLGNGAFARQQGEDVSLYWCYFRHGALNQGIRRDTDACREGFTEVDSLQEHMRKVHNLMSKDRRDKPWFHDKTQTRFYQCRQGCGRWQDRSPNKGAENDAHFLKCGSEKEKAKRSKWCTFSEAEENDAVLMANVFQLKKAIKAGKAELARQERLKRRASDETVDTESSESPAKRARSAASHPGHGARASPVQPQPARAPPMTAMRSAPATLGGDVLHGYGAQQPHYSLHQPPFLPAYGNVQPHMAMSPNTHGFVNGPAMRGQQAHLAGAQPFPAHGAVPAQQEYAALPGWFTFGADAQPRFFEFEAPHIPQPRQQPQPGNTYGNGGVPMAEVRDRLHDLQLARDRNQVNLERAQRVTAWLEVQAAIPVARPRYEGPCEPAPVPAPSEASDELYRRTPEPTRELQPSAEAEPDMENMADREWVEFVASAKFLTEKI